MAMSGIGAEIMIGTTAAAIQFGREYRQMRKELNEYLDDVDRIEWVYRRRLRTLLRSILHDEDRIQSLLQDLGGGAWQQDDLKMLIQGRLQDSYPFYHKKVGQMNSALSKLKKELGVDDDDAIQHQTESDTVDVSAAPPPPHRSSLPQHRSSERQGHACTTRPIASGLPPRRKQESRCAPK